MIGLVFVAFLLFWLAVNLVKTPADFVEIFLIGLTTGCVYALVALGYTLVYGILELINFAHGDVFMLGGHVHGHARDALSGLDAGPGRLVTARRARDAAISMPCAGCSTRRSSSSRTGRCETRRASRR